MNWPIRRFRIEGNSMEPTLSRGDFVLVNGWAYLLRSPKVGDLVVLQHPSEKRILVKRIANKRGNGYSVTGDNTHASTDSRLFGEVSRKAILGRVAKIVK